MNTSKIEQLKKLLEIANEGLTRQDFTDNFQKVLKHVLEIENKVIKRINKLESETKQGNKESLEKTLADIKQIKEDLVKDSEKMFEEQRQSLNYINEKVNSLKDGKTPVKGVDYKDGKDGKDADEKKIIKEVTKKIKVPDIKKMFNDLREEMIEEIRKHKRIGGGTSHIGVQQALAKLLKTEQPSGAINGSNKEYTVTGNIFAIFSFSLNGEVIAQLPNYTISGNKITFSTALPAAYSGKDFEVKYV